MRRAALALVLWSASALAAPDVPARPDRYATDRAGVVDGARLSALNERLAQFERETSSQVLVYVDRQLPAGVSIEDFANAAFRAWKVGQKDRDNGIVFFVFVDDRQMRIEVGYGLEGALPDIRAASIIEDYARPRFRANDFAGGVEAATDQLMRAARGEPYRGTGRTQAESDGGALPPWTWLGPLAALLIAWLVGRRGRSTWECWTRAAATGIVATLLLSLLSVPILGNARVLAQGLGFVLLWLVPLVYAMARQGASPAVRGRRALGREVLLAAGAVLAVTLGAAFFIALAGAGLRVVGYAVLATIVAFVVGGFLYARDPAQALTLVVGRLATLVFFPAALFAALFAAFGVGDIAPDLLPWAVPSGVLWLASVIVARSRGWRLWPKGSGGGYSGSGSSSDWSSSSSSDGGSSFSGGGGDSGGGGASGDW